MTMPSTSRGPAVPASASTAPTFAPPAPPVIAEPAPQPAWTPPAEPVVPQAQEFEMPLNLSEAQEAPADPQADELLLGGVEAPAERCHRPNLQCSG